MNCETIKNKLCDPENQSLTQNEKQHIQSCPSCKKTYNAEYKLLTGFSCLKSYDSCPPNLTQNIMSRLKSTQPASEPSSSSFQYSAMSLPVTLTIVGVLCGSMYFYSSHGKLNLSKGKPEAPLTQTGTGSDFSLQQNIEEKNIQAKATETVNLMNTNVNIQPQTGLKVGQSSEKHNDIVVQPSTPVSPE
ncbi:MAG: hypothetical protein HQM10_25035 [Candidatus Riflebacteria bacterium]|nr:hypothetical protein [Candidatus Riflebacteria bacterium]